MAKAKNISGVNELIKSRSSKGFDTPGLMQGWLKKAIIAAIIVVAVLLIFYILAGGTGQNTGGTRNCIKSVMGNEPDCSDNDGTPKNTYVNGEYVGVCSGVDNFGNCIE